MYIFRPRCIGFARRRVGRGGRILLDRVATNFDEFWSQLDYTILETKPATDCTISTSDKTTTILDSKKPASPPTVVDLVMPANALVNNFAGTLAVSTANKSSTSVNKTNTPAIKIKKEISDVIDHNHTMVDIRAELLRNEEESEELADCDYEYSDDENDFENECGIYKERDRHYHSCISMARKKRRRRQKIHQRENSKRSKKDAIWQQKNSELSTRCLLYKLSQSLAKTDNGRSADKNERAKNMLNRETAPTSLSSIEIKVEKLNGLNKDDEPLKISNNWSNHRCSSASVDYNKPNNINNNSSSISSFSSSPLVTGIFGNIDNNNSSSNVNKNISSGRNGSYSLSDKTNVIKTEVNVLENDIRASTASVDNSVSRIIKQELIECSVASVGSADDSNEPLSSIQKLGNSSTADIMEDEENVNLAQLSNLIKIKKEVSEDGDRMSIQTKSRNYQSSRHDFGTFIDDEEVLNLNQIADVIRVQHLKKHPISPCASEVSKDFNILIEDGPQNDDEKLFMLGGLSPTSSQRLDICNELLSEIRRDWLHFRPKTPTGALKEEDSWSLNMDYKLNSPLVDWSQHTPIAVEIVRESLDSTNYSKALQCDRLWKEDAKNDNPTFISSSFKYEDLEADTQLLQNSYLSDIIRGSSKSPDTNNSAACLDLNFSGDSLNDINLLGDGDDADMLDNILQEVQIDDIKTLNQATNFWNGILDGENVDAEVDGDVEVAAGLLDGIDDSKKFDKSTSGKKSIKIKGGKKSCALLAPVGSSSFNCSPLEKEVVSNETFFRKDDPKKEPENDTEDVLIKSEPIEVSETKTNTASSNASINNISLSQPQSIQIAPIAVTTSNSQREVIQVEQQSTAPIIITQPLQQPLQQQQQHQQMVTHSTPVQVIENVISINQNENTSPQQTQRQLQSSTVTNPSQTSLQQHQLSQQQQQLTTIQVLQQPTTQQIRNVTVQQLHQLQLQQQQHRKLQLQQQQQKLLLQRDIVNTSNASVITQYVPTSSTTTSTSIIRQPTLTPIGASSVNNSTGQMIYTATSSGDVIGTGSQKIFLQKAPVSVTSGTQGVNIINTSSGQQLTVQNIASLQHISSATGGSTSTSAAGPLIVATSHRNAVQQLAQQQQQQQLVGQSTQQIVWRQIGPNITTPADCAVAGTGNKIVWTSRPAQKRQLNGPENTGIY